MSLSFAFLSMYTRPSCGWWVILRLLCLRKWHG